MMSDVRHFIDLEQFEPDVLKSILKKAHALKAQKFNPPQLFTGLSLAMMFDKRSTRTRMSFEIAMKQLGGHTVVMNKEESQIGGAESIESSGNVMSRFVDAIMVRMSSHEDFLELAKHSKVPVINGMTDRSHPCQIMADIMTIEEKMGSAEGKKIAWFGDYNNVSQSYIEASRIFDFEFVMALPEDLNGNVPDGVSFTNDAKEAASGADVLVTDTWVSMGQEGKDIEKFWPYQVNAELMALANKDAIFMHCLPIHEWEEVSEDVARGSQSVIYDEAENRLHAQKAILAWCLEDAGVSVQQDSFNFGE
ncbi:MAG: ornithine carbamoyltransferase [Pseudomonadota bacterium]